MKNAQNKTVHSVEEILEILAFFYEKLYESDITTFTMVEENPNDPILPVTLSELKRKFNKLNKLKKEKLHDQLNIS